MSCKRYTPSSVSDGCLLVLVDFSAYLVIIVFLVVVRGEEEEVIKLDFGEITSHSAITITGVFHSQNDEIAFMLVIEVLSGSFINVCSSSVFYIQSLKTLADKIR
jgi:hypothetical protein